MMHHLVTHMHIFIKVVKLLLVASVCKAFKHTLLLFEFHLIILVLLQLA